MQQRLFEPPQDELIKASDECYTPAFIIEPARRVMGGIDLDPCSSAIANKTVKAAWFYTKEMNGLTLPWHGRIWLNPPYSEPRPWVEKLIDNFIFGHVTQAIVLLNSNTDQRYCQMLFDGLACFPDRRIEHYRPFAKDQKPNQRFAQVIAYVGHRQRAFYQEFRPLGKIVRRAIESELLNTDKGSME